jgi:hypothetical protein
MAPWNGDVFTNWHKVVLGSRKVSTKEEKLSKGARDMQMSPHLCLRHETGICRAHPAPSWQHLIKGIPINSPVCIVKLGLSRAGHCQELARRYGFLRVFMWFSP